MALSAREIRRRTFHVNTYSHEPMKSGCHINTWLPFPAASSSHLLRGDGRSRFTLEKNRVAGSATPPSTSLAPFW